MTCGYAWKYERPLAVDGLVKLMALSSSGTWATDKFRYLGDMIG
jgi:hypothetical protein